MFFFVASNFVCRSTSKRANEKKNTPTHSDTRTSLAFKVRSTFRQYQQITKPKPKKKYQTNDIYIEGIYTSKTIYTSIYIYMDTKRALDDSC